MSKDVRESRVGSKDISRTLIEGNHGKLFEGFQGMNYEQIRTPYDPTHKGRNSLSDERKDGKRPDEA